MRKLTLLLVFCLWWPFHRHAAPPPAQPESPGVVTPNGSTVHIPERFCERNEEGLYFFPGPDGMVGMSQDSCDAAFMDWNHSFSRNRPLSRI